MNIVTRKVETGWIALDKDTNLDEFGETEKDAVYNLFKVQEHLLDKKRKRSYKEVT